MIGIGQTTSGSGWEFNFVDFDGSASQNTCMKKKKNEIEK